MNIKASTGALVVAIVATATPELLRKVLLPRLVKRHYAPKRAAELQHRGFMIEAFAVWWADLSGLVVAFVSAVGAVAFSLGWRRWLAGILAMVVLAAVAEALVADPFEYEANSSTQQAVSLYRDRMGLAHDKPSFLTPSILVSGLSALVAFLFAVASVD